MRPWMRVALPPVRRPVGGGGGADLAVRGAVGGCPPLSTRVHGRGAGPAGCIASPSGPTVSLAGARKLRGGGRKVLAVRWGAPWRCSFERKGLRSSLRAREQLHHDVVSRPCVGRARQLLERAQGARRCDWERQRRLGNAQCTPATLMHAGPGPSTSVCPSRPGGERDGARGARVRHAGGAEAAGCARTHTMAAAVGRIEPR